MKILPNIQLRVGTKFYWNGGYIIYTITKQIDSRYILNNDKYLWIYKSTLRQGLIDGRTKIL